MAGFKHRRVAVRKAFTLIELLVVVAIIGILAALLLPMLAKAKDRAKVVLCVNNHKQIVVAMTLYANDHNKYLVKHKWYTDFAGWKGTHHWSPSGPRPLNAYLGGDGKVVNPGSSDGAADIMKCPADKGDARQSWNNHRWTKFGTSYAVQMASVQHCGIDRSTSTGTGGWEDNRRLNKIAYPDYKVTAYSNTWLNNRDWSSSKTRWHNQALNNGRIPCGFFDGRAEYFYIWWRPAGTWGGYSGNLDRRIEKMGYY